jgi:hypothetical protein
MVLGYLLGGDAVPLLLLEAFGPLARKAGHAARMRARQRW